MKVLVLLGALVGALAVAAGAAPAGAGKAPRVWVADQSPIVVGASGFAPRDRVEVTLVTSGKHLVKTVRANQSGGLRAQWPGSISMDACHFVAVTAVGADGRRAAYKSPRGGVECAPLQPVDQ